MSTMSSDGYRGKALRLDLTNLAPPLGSALFYLNGTVPKGIRPVGYLQEYYSVRCTSIAGLACCCYLPSADNMAA